jgi:hypothetical protein
MKNDKAIKAGRDLTKAHWKYIKKLLTMNGIPKDILEIVEFHYNTAMEHGFKHGVEYALGDLC